MSEIITADILGLTALIGILLLVQSSLTKREKRRYKYIFYYVYRKIVNIDIFYTRIYIISNHSYLNLDEVVKVLCPRSLF